MIKKIIFIILFCKVQNVFGQIALPSMRGVFNTKVPISMYSGGKGLGTPQQQIIQNYCPPEQLQTIYYGGTGNGEQQQTTIQNVCVAPPIETIFYGGTGYGNDQKLVQTNCALAPIPSVTSPNTGKIWMDRNLGASQVATAFNDALSYGDLYQWGRGADGHQLRTSANTSTTSSSDVPGHGNFITTSGSGDWRSPENTSLWQGVNGINNPCPNGYRIPTSAEWTTEFGTWSSANLTGAYNSPLKVPSSGYRSNTNGALAGQASLGYYWSSTTISTNSTFLFFKNSAVNLANIGRAWGLSVRCIKN